MKFVGKQMPAFLRRRCNRSDTDPVLHLPDLQTTIPLLGKTAYLGIIINYRAWKNDTISRRIRATQTYFYVLKGWFRNQHPPLWLCLRLYRQCIIATVFWGIIEMEIFRAGNHRLINMSNIHHRIMAKSSIHLTREPIIDFFARFQFDPPWIMLQQQYTGLQQTLSRQRSTLSTDAISPDADDVIALTPDYPQCHIHVPDPAVDPCAQVGAPKCLNVFVYFIRQDRWRDIWKHITPFHA